MLPSRRVRSSKDVQRMDSRRGQRTAISAPEHHARRRLIGGLTVAGFTFPVAAFLWFLQHYGVNMIYADQWHDVDLIAASYSHKLSSGALCAQNAAHRLLFPHLIALLPARTTHS